MFTLTIPHFPSNGVRNCLAMLHFFFGKCNREEQCGVWEIFESNTFGKCILPKKKKLNPKYKIHVFLGFNILAK